MKELWLRKGEDRRLIAGHLWIFANEVDVQKSPLGDFAPGEEALVRNARGQALGSAFVNPHSLICARIHSREAGRPLDGALLRQRLATALSLREGRFDSPYYRVCHGEGDMLPGLVIDRFDGHVAVQIGTAGMEVRKDMIREALHSLFSPSSILWDNDLPSRGLEGLARENELEGHAPRELDVPENGCRFFAPCRTGQKTGWFYDQRRNRAEAARYANGAHVLDIFSYAGGFGGTAARAGAASVTFIDASQTAVDYAARNAARGLTAKQNLAIKCAQIPAYVLNFALAILGVTMSVFGLPMIFWAIAIDFLSILTTGISAIGCGRTLCKTGKIAKTAAAWTTIGSFVYCADVAIAVAWYCRERGNGQEETRG